jgi:hypothetical protein
VQWCVAIQRGNVAVGPNTEKIAHDLDVSPSCGTKQSGLADGVTPVYVGTGLYQTDDLVKVTVPRGPVEARLGGAIISCKSSVTHENGAQTQLRRTAYSSGGGERDFHRQPRIGHANSLETSTQPKPSQNGDDFRGGEVISETQSDNTAVAVGPGIAVRRQSPDRV